MLPVGTILRWRPEPKPTIYLCNACDWGGFEEELVRMKHGFPGHLCPECHETTTPFSFETAVQMMHEHCNEFPHGG